MDVEAELAAVRSRAARLADRRLDEMRRSLLHAGAEDRRIIREADGLPAQLGFFARVSAAMTAFADAFNGNNPGLRLRHELLYGVAKGKPGDYVLTADG